MPQPSGCVDSIQKSLKEFLWGAVSEFLPWTSIQLVSSGEDILVSEALDRSSLWDKGPEQAIVSLVLRTLPGGVRMGEENLAAPVLHLGEVAGRKILCKRFSTKSRMALESRADSGLNPLITESHGGQSGMRAGTA